MLIGTAILKCNYKNFPFLADFKNTRIGTDPQPSLVTERLQLKLMDLVPGSLDDTHPHKGTYHLHWGEREGK